MHLVNLNHSATPKGDRQFSIDNQDKSIEEFELIGTFLFITHATLE